jgi:hypothetical protein
MQIIYFNEDGSVRNEVTELYQEEINMFSDKENPTEEETKKVAEKIKEEMKKEGDGEDLIAALEDNRFQITQHSSHPIEGLKENPVEEETNGEKTEKESSGNHDGEAIESISKEMPEFGNGEMTLIRDRLGLPCPEDVSPSHVSEYVKAVKGLSEQMQRLTEAMNKVQEEGINPSEVIQTLQKTVEKDQEKLEEYQNKRAEIEEKINALYKELEELDNSYELVRNGHWSNVFNWWITVASDLEKRLEANQSKD